MKRIVANALFLPEVEKPSPNLWGKLRHKPSEIYLRNAYCSLFSVKQYNPGIELLLIYSGRIPEAIQREFSDLGVRLVELPFSVYRVPDRFPWSAAYYKLDAVEWLTRESDQFFLIDTDTVCTGPLDDVWAEAEDRILLFETGHRVSHRFRDIINRFGAALDGKAHRAIHYGGEAIAASRAEAAVWVQNMWEVFALMQDHWDFFDAQNPEQSDEMVVSLVAERMSGKIGSLKPYLERYWTMDGFRLLSTNYKFNAVDIWHLPWEKRSGLMRLYGYIRKHNRLPPRGDLIRMMHLETGIWSGLVWQLRKLKRTLVGPRLD
jgi:hypothetical protein